MENAADSSDKKIYEKPVIAKCGDFRNLTGAFSPRNPTCWSDAAE
ncbi:keywimysin-related RiPP [Nocardia sp. AB354]